MSGSGKQLLAIWINKTHGGGIKTNQVIKESITADQSDATANLKNCSLYHYKSLEGKLKSCFIVTVKHNLEDELSTLLLLLKEKEKKISHLEMRVSPINGATDIYIEIESKYFSDWNSLTSFVETLTAIEIYPRENQLEGEGQETKGTWATSSSGVSQEKVWFPHCIKEIDNFQHVLTYGNELDADHPGFTDKKYRRRRKTFAEIALFYKHGDPIPRINYTAEENATWRAVYTNLEVMHEKYACAEFKKYWKELKQFCHYGPDKIPQLEDVNNFLKTRSGFQVRPVAGYLSPRDFLSGLAFRVFHCTQYIRHGSDPLYTPEPDCVHELIGHIPLLADKKIAQFSQDIGMASLGLDDENLKKLSSAYFFTIEFGLCVEEGKLKIYGAGLLSSASEMKHVMDGTKEGKVCVVPFDLEKAASTPCIVTSYQRRYFVTENILKTQDQIRNLAKSISDPYKLRYNPYTQCIEKIGSKGEIEDFANELRGDLYLVQQAMQLVKEKGNESSCSFDSIFDSVLDK